jgi:hypothetical protein
MPTLAWVFATMQRRRRSECTILRPYFLFDASAIFAVAGSRSRPTLRFAHTLFFAQCRFYFALTWYLVQNTRYVVVSGARRKEEDWDPAENGGFAVIGSHTSLYVSRPKRLTPPSPSLQIQTVKQNPSTRLRRWKRRLTRRLMLQRYKRRVSNN